MAVPVIQQIRVGSYIMKQRIKGVEKYPLVLMLHGYGANSFVQDGVFGLQDRVDSHQFILILADGTVDAGGSQFWNAFNECCDFYGTNVKDNKWLSKLIE